MFKLGAYKQFLNKNERNKVYLRKNSAKGKRIADSKYRTKKILDRAGVGVPELIVKIDSEQELDKFRWEDLEGNFVVKPVLGFGGDGIIVVRKRGKWAGEWLKMDGGVVTSQDIRQHCLDILAGKYSLHGSLTSVLVEERIKIHPWFLAFTRSGTPDIRVIIYNRVPVMAMLRLPSEESKGKANLQQGGYGLGIDLATGITTYGIKGKGEEIKKIYDYKKKKYRKVNGIKIPFWKKILETSIVCQKAIPSLGFMGVDVVLDKEKGPMVLEVNARPGLSIQLCNKAGLKRRIEKIADLEVKSVSHAVFLTKYLFGEGFFEKVKDKNKRPIVEPLEKIKVKLGKGKKNILEIKAKVDTGAFRSSIDEKVAKEHGLLAEEKVLYYRHYRSSLGKHKDRPVIGLTFWLKGKKVITAVNVANRDRLRTKFLLGRRDLKGFLVSPKRETKNEKK